MYLVHDIAKITKTNRFHPILVEYFHFSPLIENKFLIPAIYVPVKKQQNAIYSKGNRWNTYRFIVIRLNLLIPV